MQKFLIFLLIASLVSCVRHRPVQRGADRVVGFDPSGELLKWQPENSPCSEYFSAARSNGIVKVYFKLKSAPQVPADAPLDQIRFVKSDGKDAPFVSVPRLRDPNPIRYVIEAPPSIYAKVQRCVPK